MIEDRQEMVIASPSSCAPGSGPVRNTITKPTRAIRICKDCDIGPMIRACFHRTSRSILIPSAIIKPTITVCMIEGSDIPRVIITCSLNAA